MVTKNSHELGMLIVYVVKFILGRSNTVYEMYFVMNW